MQQAMIIAGVIFMGIMAVAVVVARRTSRTDVSGRIAQFAGGAAVASGGNFRQHAMDRLEEAVGKSKRAGNMKQDLARADLRLRVAEFVAIKIVAALVGSLFGAAVGRADSLAMIISGIVGAAIFFFVPDIYVRWRIKKRIKSFNRQLGDTISMMSNSLRSGYSFLQTLDLVAKEAPQPVSAEFRRIVQEVGLGRTTEQALAELLRRVPSDDLEMLITAVNIQQEVGGNLAQLLDMMAHTIRERVRIKGEIQTLTAQGRVSGYVITGMPLALGVMISLMNPDYMTPIFSFGFPPKAWCCLPVGALMMVGVGYFAIMKIIDIEV